MNPDVVNEIGAVAAATIIAFAVIYSITRHFKR